MENIIEISYYKPETAKLDLNHILKVFKEIEHIEDLNSEDIDNLITLFGDNTSYYLEKAGFVDIDLLDDDTLDYICDEFFKILNK